LYLLYKNVVYCSFAFEGRNRKLVVDIRRFSRSRLFQKIAFHIRTLLLLYFLLISIDIRDFC